MTDKSYKRWLSDIMWKRPDGSVCGNQNHQWTRNLVCEDCALWAIGHLHAKNEQLRELVENCDLEDNKDVILTIYAMQHIFADGMCALCNEAPAASQPPVPLFCAKCNEEHDKALHEKLLGIPEDN